MAYLTDSLRSAIQGVRSFGRGLFGGTSEIALGHGFGHQLAIAAYMASGMMRKVIAIPAEDRVREWRDWQADAETIAAIEEEEKRLGLQSKVEECETLRGVGGGALILITAGDHSTPLTSESIKAGGLVAANVVSRWEITGKDWVKNVADPNFRQPKYWEMRSDQGQTTILHPSRVVCFTGKRLPAGTAVSDEEVFWGDSKLVRVFTEVNRSDETQGWFAALVRKAKLLRIGIPDLLDMVATEQGRATLDARVALIAEGENTLNATVYRSGTGTDDPGEKLDDYQITWAGIPAMMDAFDQRVAAVADIPFTRLMGRSPAGMNATGEHDNDNWNKSVVSGQKLELRPCLDKIDVALLPSAGADPKKVTWAFAPLDTPSEKEVADTFKTTVDALEKLNLMGVMPEEAFNELAQNLLAERQWLPGIDTVLAKFSEEELLAGSGEDEVDPSEIVEGGDPASAGGGARRPAARAANDAKPRTLYVKRMLLPEDARKFIAWAKAQGFKGTVPAESLHVTVFSSTNAVDWIKAGTDWNEDESGEMFVPAGGARIVEPLGDKGAAVLLFNSSRLAWRHESIARDTGAQDRFPDYQPHLTIVYEGAGDMDLSKVEPYRGALRFGPEIFEEAIEGWRPEGS